MRYLNRFQYDCSLVAKACDVRLLVMDVDGVMTDGGLIHGDNGLEYKRFHARDGLGLRMLRESGVALAIITGRTSKVVENRASEIGTVALVQGCHDKLPAFEQVCCEYGIDQQQAAFIGDDVIDLPAMRHAGIGMCVADAHPLVLEHAQWTAQTDGGQGAVRDAAEFLMYSQGTLQKTLERYLQ